jgi:4-amino-4-deoxy-L-arabinose transferase-like glycosyltransferase
LVLISAVQPAEEAQAHSIPNQGLHSYAAFLLSSRAKVWHAVLALSGLHFLITGWNLNLQHIISPDEPRYACAARHMIESGNYIVPFFNARPRLEKPVFFHWMLTVSGRVSQALGISLDTMGFRFVPVIMGWLVVLALYLLARRLLNHRGAFIAAIVLLTSYDFHETSRELVVDMTLAACVIWSWLLFHISLGRLERNEKAWLPLLGMYLCLGCGCMTKGPFLLGIFFIVPVLAYLFWTKRLPVLTRAGLWWGVPLSVIIGFHWFILVKQSGEDPVSFFAIENIARFFGRKDHIEPWPFWFYIRTAPLFFAPWVLFVPFATFWTYKKFHDHRTTFSDGAKLATCALGISFFFIGMSVSKRHLYLIPLFPFLALWIGWFLERLCFKSEAQARPKAGVAYLLRVAGVILFLGFLSAFYWLPKIGGQSAELTMCAILGVVVLASALISARVASQGNRLAACGYMLIVPLLLAFSLELVRRPVHERELNLTGFYDSVREKLGDRHLAFIGINSNEASWYLEKTPGPIDQLKQSEIKSCFFDAPHTAMLVSLHYLNSSELLKTSTRPLSDTLLRNRDPFMLIEPDPDHPPDPALFKVHLNMKSAVNVDDL